VLHVVVDIALIAYLVALAQVLNLFGGAGHQVAHGPARRTVARHSQAGHTQGSALPTSKPAQRLAPQPIPATVRVQPVPVAARNATR
jgi:hypothetical protein